MALGIALILLILLSASLRAAIALGAAYALTTLVALSGTADVLVWVAAGGFALLQFVGAFIALAAAASAAPGSRRRTRR